MQAVAPDRTLLRTTWLVHADPAYEPGPYAPNEGQVEAFVTWYAGRLRAHA